MSVSHHAQAVLLLAARLSGKEAGTAVRPLTNTEWARFARWLHERGMRPEQLLGEGRDEVLGAWTDEKIDRERLRALLDRGPALALALDKWLNAGLWIITRADPDYPQRLKQRLGWTSPPVLFGCGGRALLGRGGLAVVGSRDAPPEDLAYSRRVGARAAEASIPIISGGARGIDEEAMLGALEAGGTVIGVLADSLLRATAQSRYRSHLMSSNLALISPYHPDARFLSGNAMGRNRYIYCLAHAAVAVHSRGSGGTWSGANEALKHGWCTLWVKVSGDPTSANAKLIELGGKALSADADEIDLTAVAGTSPYELQPQDDGGRIAEPARDVHDPYEVFLTRARQLCFEKARTPDELAAVLGVKKTQLAGWLKRAVLEKRIRKLVRPVRYAWQDADVAQLELFEG